MSRLKIAIVASNIHFRGGMERYCAELARAFCRDHDVHLFACEVDDVPLDRVTIHRVPTVKKPFITLFAQFYLRSSRQIHLSDYDIVHTIGGITAHQNVITSQYCQFAWGDALRREAGNIGGITPYHQLMWRIAGMFERRAVISAETKAISANSRRTKEDLQKYYGCSPSKIDVIYNGVDPNLFSPDNQRFRDRIRDSHGIAKDRLLIVFAGEYRRKGLATVIRALGLLKNPNLHLLAVGRGDRARYENLASSLGVADQVTLSMPTSAIAQIYGAGDMFVFPTFYEPFGMVITEAMASGLPVITTERAGASEFIERGKSGLLVSDPNDAASFAENIQKLADDPGLRNSMAIEAREAVRSYDWQTVADKTLALYQRVHSGSPIEARPIIEPV